MAASIRTFDAKAPGRGAWIGVTRAELQIAMTKGMLKGALARAFKTGEFTIPPDLPAIIDAALERNALDRLGLESKIGTLMTGSERIEAQARSGKLHALYHAVRRRHRRQPQARPGVARWLGPRGTCDVRGLALPGGRAPYWGWRWAARMWYISA